MNLSCGSLEHMPKIKEMFVYELPENVVEVKEVFLDDALHVKDTGKLLHIFTREEQDSLRELMDCGRPDWEVLFALVSR